MNYNTSSALTLKANWMYEAEYINLPRFTNSVSTPFGCLIINQVGFPLQKEATTTAPTYTIYARMINPTLKVPTHITSGAPTIVSEGEEIISKMGLELFDQQWHLEKK